MAPLKTVGSTPYGPSSDRPGHRPIESPPPVSIPSENALAPLPNWVLSAQRRQLFTSDGHVLHVSTWPIPKTRSNAKPKGTVVILQGAGQSAYRWEHTARFLSRRRGQRVITYDHRGKGLSGRLAKDNRCHIDDFSRYANDAIDVLKQLKAEGSLKPPVTVLGYSMGGAVAIDALSRRSDLADRLVLVAPMSGFSPEAAKPRCLVPLLRVVPGAMPFLMSALAGVQTLLGRGSQPVWGLANHRDRYLAQGPVRSTANERRLEAERKAAHVLPDMVVGAMTWKFFGQLARGANRARYLANKVTCPTLVVSAGDDSVVCSASHSRLARRLPNCVGFESIPDAAHAPHLGFKEEQRQFFGALDRFFVETA